VDDIESSRRDGIDLARRALRFARDDPDVLASAGFALGFLGEDINAAIGLIDRSLMLNPSFARGWHWSGVLKNFAGQFDLGIEHLETSLRLSPRGPLGGDPGTALGAAHFFNHRFDDAAAILVGSLERASTFVVTYRLLASCYAHMGRLDDAREIVSRLRAITPVVIPSIIPYRNPEHRKLFLSGLRLATGEAE
jgi:adenylate cyclase